MARCDTLQHAARLWKDKAIALERALADLQTQVDAGTALPRGKAPHDTVSPSRLTVRAHDAAVAGERSPARGGLLHTALSHPASEEVLINALAAIFVTVEADSSNMVTAFELRAFVSRDVGLGQGLGEQLCRLLAADGDLEAAMGAHDANKDGVMSVDEFVSMAVATLRAGTGDVGGVRGGDAANPGQISPVVAFKDAGGATGNGTGSGDGSASGAGSGADNVDMDDMYVGMMRC